MQKPTYKQISELYHDMQELEHKLEDLESERDMLKEIANQESQYSDYLLHIILRARDALKTGHIEFAKLELEKV